MPPAIRKFPLIALALLACVGLPSAVQAQSVQDLQNQLDPGRRASKSRQQMGEVKLSERQAVAQARAKAAGNVLRISLVGEGANQRYQIRMEHDGKVFTLFVHARTGKVTQGDQ